MDESKPVIIFDGVCNACNGWVRFVLRHDPDRQFRFAPNQSEIGKELLRKFDLPTESVSSIYLVIGDQYFEKSNAAIQILCRLKLPWKLAILLKIFPRFVRDWVYDWVARNRYRWFGRSATCSMPMGWGKSEKKI
jgi:predicted DCC family thiol-disulfide oxidoreductase YuxK